MNAGTVTVLVVALIILVSAIGVGLTLPGERRHWYGVLVDERNRMSLSRLQLALWTFVLLPLIVGLALARILDQTGGAEMALDFSIPPEVWGLLGISVGSKVAASAVKASKDAQEDHVGRPLGPHIRQLVTVEEGAGSPDAVIDVGKFQNLWFSLLLLVAYAASAVAMLREVESPDSVNSLPGLSAGFLVLLGISHGGYVASKIVGRAGDPADGLSLATAESRIQEANLDGARVAHDRLVQRFASKAQKDPDLQAEAQTDARREAFEAHLREARNSPEVDDKAREAAMQHAIKEQTERKLRDPALTDLAYAEGTRLAHEKHARDAYNRATENDQQRTDDQKQEG